MKSFYRKMVEEKGLIDKPIEVTSVEQVTHYMTVENVIEFIESSPKNIQGKIRNTMSLIDLKDGDLLNYLEFIAKGIVDIYDN